MPHGVMQLTSLFHLDLHLRFRHGCKSDVKTKPNNPELFIQMNGWYIYSRCTKRPVKTSIYTIQNRVFSNNAFAVHNSSMFKFIVSNCVSHFADFRA